MNEPASYKPSAFYFRRLLRGTDDPTRLRNIGLALVGEIEQLKEWVRAHDLIPPKWNVPAEEAADKGWRAPVVQADFRLRRGF